MLNHEIEEKLAERLVDRIEEANTSILKKIGNAIKTISTLTPSQAYQVSQILKYGGSYEEIAKELAKISGKNIQDIYKIFDEVAKNNKQFAKEFYRYRGRDYIPYNKDSALRQQVRSIADITANNYMNISRTSGIGFLFEDINGQMTFKNIQQTYYEVIDRGILSISQGKTSFYEEMRRIMKQLGHSGVVLYDNGRTRRLDSAVRMNMLDGIRQLNNETAIRFGKEYDADGIEVSVHSNPAPDHADIQGRQFRNKAPEGQRTDWERIQDGERVKDYTGVYRQLEHSKKGTYRPISEYNCYHKIFTIVLGVSKPQYTDEQLKKIQEENEKGFEFEGKHYTNYEGQQLQRRIELEIRKQKDTNILARASGDEELAQASELKIRQLTSKYNDLCKTSGLVPQKQRMSVSGYKRMSISNKVKEVKEIKLTDAELDDQFYMLSQDLKEKNIEIDNSIFNIPDKELRNRQLEQLDKLSDNNDHNYISKQKLILEKGNTKKAFATSWYYDHSITLGEEYYDNTKQLLDAEKKSVESGWHVKVNEKDYDIYTITHEYGHMIEYEFIKEKLLRKKIIPSVATIGQRRLLDKELQDTLLDRAMRRLDKKITKTEFKEKYWSKYARSKRNFEWFAESFTQAGLTKDSNVWIDTFKEWLDDFNK